MIDLKNQSTQFYDKSAKCSSIVEPGKYLLSCNVEIKTVLDCLYHGYQQSKENDCIGFRSPYSGVYEWFSYAQTTSRMRTFGSGLVNIGCPPSNSTLIGFFGKNNLKLLIAEYACYHYSMVVVPIFDIADSNVCQFILNQTEPKCVIVDSNERAKRLLTLSKQIPFSSLILTCDHINQDTRQLALKKSINLYSFADIEKIGTENMETLKIPIPTDLAVISYTSGTTGFPKGSLLTHANLVAAASGILMHINPYISLKEETMVAYMSMGHSFQRIIQICMFYCGGRVGIYTGDFKDLSKDLFVLQPTVMTCVPRIMNRIYNRVISKVRGNWIAARLLDIALRAKQSNPESKKNHTLWDSLAFKTVRQILGGNLKIIISGAQQLSPTVKNFIRSAFGCIVIEGYCLTECSAFVTLTHCTDQSTGNLGPPLSCNVIKLVEVPELNLSTETNGIGEIYVKGTNVFSGYYKENTFSELVDEENWFHTGDLGQWEQNGTLKVWGRKEYFVKLATDQCVAPEKIENTYHQSRYVSQCFVDGDSSRSFIVGIIVPDVDSINIWCNENSMIFSAEEACRNLAFKQLVLSDIISISRRDGLEQHEQVKDIYLHSDPFSVESGLLTPTMKLKRIECKNYFREQLDNMYRINEFITTQK